MKAAHKLPIFWIMTLLVLICEKSTAQFFENTFGDPHIVEHANDGKQLPNGKFIVLGTRDRASGSIYAEQILLTELDPGTTPAGKVSMYVSLFDPGHPDLAYKGSAIELCYDNASNWIGYYITGYRIIPGDNLQMILLQTDRSGNLIWAKYLDNFSDGVLLKEKGVSIERQPDGDVIVIGNWSRGDGHVGDNGFSAARFNFDGTADWQYRYKSAGGNYIAFGSCNGQNDASSNITGPVVAITGRWEPPGGAIAQSFVACLHAVTGEEIFRRVYSWSPPCPSTEGRDIVQSPSNLHFMVVGKIRLCGSGSTLMWAFQTNADGELVANSGVAYLPGIGSPDVVKYGKFFASNACLSPDGSFAVAAGYVEILKEIITNTGTTIIAVPYTYAMELPFDPVAAAPNWTYYYSDSYPEEVFPASIAPAQTVASNTGYFIATNALLTASAAPDFDEHGIFINLAGHHLLSDCPDYPIPTRRNTRSFSFPKPKAKTESNWNVFYTYPLPIAYEEEPCSGTSFSGGDERESIKSDASRISSQDFPNPKLVPNPAAVGQMVHLTFALTETESVQIQVFDLLGNQIWYFDQRLPAGSQELELPSNTWASGTYFVRLKSLTWNQSLKTAVCR